MAMKDYFILLDIDGCITNGKSRPIDLTLLYRLQQLIQKNKLNVALCTGRSSAYVEAMCQLLHINAWCICENGCYLYNPLVDKIIINTEILLDNRDYLANLKDCLRNGRYKDCYSIESGKEICISLNPIDIHIGSLYECISQVIDLTQANITCSTTAIDITPKNIDKGSGYDFWYHMMNIKGLKTIGIGDSNNDLAFLKKCNIAACPNNADIAIKNISSLIATKDSTLGVIEIIKRLLCLV